MNGRWTPSADFQCGAGSLDAHLKTQASQDVRRKANAVFVLVATHQPRRILGYFTLCAHGLAPGEVPDEARKHLPRSPLVSATLIGRLAIATSHQGQRLGGAATFYAAHGFVRLPESLRLVMPMACIGKLFASGPGLRKAPR